MGLFSSKQRWICLRCKGTSSENQYRKKYFKQFKLWISTQSPLFVIAKLAGVSTKTLQRAFDTYLSNPPKPKKLKTRQEVWLKVDATYFSKWGCLIVYKAGDTILYWECATREYDLAYEQGLRLLTQMGCIILGVENSAPRRCGGEFLKLKKHTDFSPIVRLWDSVFTDSK